MTSLTNTVSPVQAMMIRSSSAMIGMVAFIASWAMLFGGLFFAFGLLRLGSEAWPPVNVINLPIALPAINTGILLSSSVLLMVAMHYLRKGNERATVHALLIATILGIMFVVTQAWLWNEMSGLGLNLSDSHYGGLFYMFTVIHVIHVVVGIGGLLALTINAYRGRYTQESHLPVRLWSMYWHFVGVVWIPMFVLLFLS